MSYMSDRFGMRAIQDALVIVRHLLENKLCNEKEIENFLIAEMEDYFGKAVNTKQLIQLDPIATKCPKCNKHLAVKPIRVKNKFDYKTHWFCVNDDCMYEKYTKNDLKTELKKAGAIPKRRVRR